MLSRNTVSKSCKGVNHYACTVCARIAGARIVLRHGRSTHRRHLVLCSIWYDATGVAVTVRCMLRSRLLKHNMHVQGTVQHVRAQPVKAFILHSRVVAIGRIVCPLYMQQGTHPTMVVHSQHRCCAVGLNELSQTDVATQRPLSILLPSLLISAFTQSTTKRHGCRRWSRTQFASDFESWGHLLQSTVRYSQI